MQVVFDTIEFMLLDKLSLGVVLLSIIYLVMFAGFLRGACVYFLLSMVLSRLIIRYQQIGFHYGFTDDPAKK